jgi:nucleotide-binding universal stress UspA family protein
MNELPRSQPVVVAVDGSKAAIAAAEWAAKEALHQDARLRIVHVVQNTCPATPSAGLDGAEQQYGETCLREAFRAVQALQLPIAIDTALLYGSVGPVLIAESSSASLICVGSSGIDRVAAAAYGSTATALAEGAFCPVAIIRCEQGGALPVDGFIVAVLDGCADDDEAMVWALEEARARRAPVLVLGVFPWPLFDIDDERFYERLNDWLRRYPDVTCEFATTRLSAPWYLESFAGAIQLVVIGQGDADSIRRLVGPHHMSILPHANCSLLVARPVNREGHNAHTRLVAAERSSP